jgi:hypothetical protein
MPDAADAAPPGVRAPGYRLPAGTRVGLVLLHVGDLQRPVDRGWTTTDPWGTRLRLAAADD